MSLAGSNETVRDTNMFYNEILIGTYAFLKSVISLMFADQELFN